MDYVWFIVVYCRTVTESFTLGTVIIHKTLINCTKPFSLFIFHISYPSMVYAIQSQLFVFIVRFRFIFFFMNRVVTTYALGGRFARPYVYVGCRHGNACFHPFKNTWFARMRMNEIHKARPIYYYEMAIRNIEPLMLVHFPFLFI